MRTRLSVIAIAWFGALFASGHAASAELRDFDAKSPSKIAGAHAGRPYVLAFWSIHCEPCRAEMPQWSTLRRRYPGVDFILVDTDSRKERPQVLRVLAKYDMNGVQTWAYNDEFDERVRFAVDREWRGELPRTYLIDREHRAQVRSGVAEPAWIEPWLARESAASGPDAVRH